MARGSQAKIEVEKKIIEAFGDKYLGTEDKKIYVLADDGGEQVQIAISMTCPKNGLAVAAAATEDTGDWDFSDDNPVTKASPFEPAKVTKEEEENIAKMMERLGL